MDKNQELNNKEEFKVVEKNEIKGKANELKGKITGDDSDELKGKAQQGLGKAKEKVKEVADDVSEKVNHIVDDLKSDSGKNWFFYEY